MVCPSLSASALMYPFLDLLSLVIEAKADVLENPNFVYSVLRSHQDFQTLATFTLMSGLRDIQKKKANRAGTSSSLLTSPTPSTFYLSSYLPLISYLAPSREDLAARC